MRKFNTFILMSFLVIIFTGCNLIGNNEEEDLPDLKINTKSTVVNESLLDEEYAIVSWNSLSFNADRFGYMEKGDKIEIQAVATADYSRVLLYDTSWKNHFFSNVQCNPETAYVKQTWTADDNVTTYDVTKIPLVFNGADSSIYTITVILSEDDADAVKERGLLLTGDNYIIKSINISYTKQEDISEYTFAEQYALYADHRNSIIKKYSAKYDVPMVFITTENRVDILKKEYYTSMIDVVNCNDEYTLSKSGQVKVRGNSTAWSPTSKPYRIKFDKKQNMLGLHNGNKYKSWVLLKAGGFAAQDYLGFNLAHEIYKTSSYEYYASDSTFVHVFVNDIYKGVYLLCEQNQVNKGRVDVEENEDKSTDVKTGYMIELDNYAWEDVGSGNGRWFGENNQCSKGAEDYHFYLKYQTENSDGEKSSITLKDVNGEERTVPNDDFTLKSDIYSDDQVLFIQKYTENLWNICYEAIEKGNFYKFDDNYDLVAAPEFTSAKDVCDAVVDLESLCNEMILEEIVRDNDVGAGSLYMAIDFTKSEGEKYSKFTFECPWDFNWGYQYITSDNDKGAYWNGKTQYFAGGWQSLEVGGDGYERSHPWFILFNNASWFREMLREKWNQIGTSNLKTVANETDKTVSTCGNDIGGASSTWVTDFVRSRIDYIDNNLWR